MIETEFLNALVNSVNCANCLDVSEVELDYFGLGLYISGWELEKPQNVSEVGHYLFLKLLIRKIMADRWSVEATLGFVFCVAILLFLAMIYTRGKEVVNDDSFLDSNKNSHYSLNATKSTAASSRKGTLTQRLAKPLPRIVYERNTEVDRQQYLQRRKLIEATSRSFMFMVTRKNS